MKTLIALLLISTAAHASVMGILMSSEMVTTVDYNQAWLCTYSANGQTVQVTMRNFCPGTMMFN